MRRTMTPEARAALQEASAQKMAGRQKKLVVGPWQVYRFDAFNVALQKNDDEPGFYPDAASALRAMFRKMIEPSAKQDLAAHVRLVEKSERAITEALAVVGAGNLFGGVEA